MGNPEAHLPSNITQLTGFGERASWSPDGKRIAFMARSFKDAFEIYTCYRSPYADVLGYDLSTGRITTYRKLPNEYNEVEGIYPDGKYALVESSRDQGPDRQNSNHVDIRRLKLEANSTDFVRMTRWGHYDGYKASNPVVSPDEKWIAFQSARSADPAGVGYGIFLLKLK